MTVKNLHTHTQKNKTSKLLKDNSINKMELICGKNSYLSNPSHVQNS